MHVETVYSDKDYTFSSLVNLFYNEHNILFLVTIYLYALLKVSTFRVFVFILCNN
jgi:hypothetical protein